MTERTQQDGCQLDGGAASPLLVVAGGSTLLVPGVPEARQRHGVALWPGLLLACGIAVAGQLVSPVLSAVGLAAGAMVVAMLLGLAAAQWRAMPAVVLPGLDFAARPLLRFAVVLLGLRICLPQMAAVGTSSLMLVTAIVVATLVLGYSVSRRLGLSPDLAWLLASGHAVCGAAAIAAADSVLQAKQRDVTQALTLVTLFGTLVMLLLPMIGTYLELPPNVYGFWVGGSVHEVAQAMAAGYARGEACGEAASIIKLLRVAHLLPLGLLLLGVVARRARGGCRGRLVVPWFVLGFAAVAGLDAGGFVPPLLADALRWSGGFAMTIAMAALGLKSSLRDLATAGLRPLLAAAATTTGIVVGALLLAWHCA